MRAFAVRSFGEAPAILDLPRPVPNEAEDFLVRVACAGLNPIDHKRVDGLTADAKFPHVLGIDFAGTLERVPSGGHGFRVGDRVFGMARRIGTYSEATLVSPSAPGEALARIPDDVTVEQAAALPVAGVAALGALHLLDLRDGQTLVIIGAAGVVGGYAVPLARARGVDVIAVTRGDGDEALRLGADTILDPSAGGIPEQLRAAHPGGVDAVLDLVNGPDDIRKMAAVLRHGGRLVSAQRTADEAFFQARGVRAHNIAAPHNPRANRGGLDELAALVAGGVIRTRIAFTTDLDHADDALQRARRGVLRGKALIRVGETTAPG